MNPLIEKMLESTVETYLLEDLFEQEAECESRYHWSQCTETVTHRGGNCKRLRNICDDAAQYVRDGIESSDWCEDCQRDCAVCWTIRPI